MKDSRISLSVCLAIAISAALPFTSDAEDAITIEEAGSRMGQSVSVRGTVFKLARPASGHVYLNFGAAYPDQKFNVFIPNYFAPGFSGLEELVGAEIIVTGVIENFNGKPQIAVKSPSQLASVPRDPASPVPAASDVPAREVPKATPLPAPTLPSLPVPPAPALLETPSQVMPVHNNLYEVKRIDGFGREVTEFGGIGASFGVDKKGGSLEITELFDRELTGDGGMLVNDQIIKVDGTPISAANAEEGLRLLRGAPDSVVEILISRESEKSPRKFVVKRIKVQMVKTKDGWVRLP